ncbi:MAG TPA: toxin-antitoxin system antitoxin subunit [Phycicoccus sp.]|jgi:plasmid stability protein|nr:toxin-antitoxin system antitoxin subunit [Phycicoccus sp.]HQV91895.1 toxin-antitoxin system antitoxin subunit [Phycicoccus sp.]HQY97814.1 toxin-antitoxin system antitoxin subunit [Phycicoccus sp.]HRA45488.1 toxin-antitoxin system antitoxin subunit [Phycicoccus sp.]
MGTLTIRNLDDITHARLRVRAARNGRSVEAEVRAVLAEATGAPDENVLMALNRAVAGEGADLEIPSRTDFPRSVDFG